MKILVIATTKFELDGISNVILNYYRSLNHSLMHMDFVCPNILNEKLDAELSERGSQVTVLNMRKKKPFQYMEHLVKVMEAGAYDVVHAHGNSCTLALEMVAAKRAGIKVRIPHSHNSTCKHMLAHKVLWPIFSRSYTHAFACGDAAGKWLYRSKPFAIINNGIDVNRFSYDEDVRKAYREKHNLEGYKVVGHIGHFSYQKNHDYLIDVFNKLFENDKSYKLMLIGDGPLRLEVTQKIKDLGLEDAVLQLGKTYDVPMLLQAMDLMIMPSRYEGLPLTLVEAQAACLPCFIADTISDEVEITPLVNFLPLESDPEHWAQFIDGFEYGDRLAQAERIRKKIAQEGYSIAYNANRLLELYKFYLELNGYHESLELEGAYARGY